jgi:hypothetical protein
MTVKQAFRGAVRARKKVGVTPQERQAIDNMALKTRDVAAFLQLAVAAARKGDAGSAFFRNALQAMESGGVLVEEMSHSLFKLARALLTCEEMVPGLISISPTDLADFRKKQPPE